MVKTILVIEDDKSLQTYLKELLEKNMYLVKTLSDGINVLNIIEKIEPSLVILDLGLPTLKGESVCKEIKKEYPNLPIVVLTGKTALSDKINAFELGADDYITKPFEAEELILRIKARLKDTGDNNKILKVADLEINTENKEVKRGGKLLNLTPQEFRLLECLIANVNKVLSRDVLLSKIWPNSLEIETRVVDVYISYLRKKIDARNKNKLISSVRGFGYIIKEP